MSSPHKPRAGSLQFWPRVRAKRIYSSIKAISKNNSQKITGFAGYKTGMTHLIEKDTRSNSLTKNLEISVPVTIIECPPLKPFSLRFYKQTPYGSNVISEVLSKNLDKLLSKKITMPKKQKNDEFPKEYDEIRLSVYTQPKLTGIGKKKPEIFEIPLRGDLEFAKSLLNKEIKLSEIFKAGQYIDIHAISKGKGFQGPVKRFGISLKSHKSEKKRRSPGNLGAFTPRKVDWRVPQHGQHGYHKRTEYNKLIYYIGSDLEKINQIGGIKKYGKIKNEFILIKGSVIGPSKRLIIFTKNIRDKKDVGVPEIIDISTSSKQ
jgi:large subunit ribosomal protein L3